jgi:hypothetical protein
MNGVALCGSWWPSERLNVYFLSLLARTVDFRKFEHLLAYDIPEPEVVTFYLGSLDPPNLTPEEMTRTRGSLAAALNLGALISAFDENEFLTAPEFDAWFR